MSDSDLPVTVHVRDPQGYDLYIGRAMPALRLRASKWRNRYKLSSWHPTIASLLYTYEQSVRCDPDLMAGLPELAGLRLGCWCAKPGQVLTADDPLVCHGQVLARLFREVSNGS